MQAHELLPIVATPPSTCTTNPLRLAPLCLSTCFDSFASSSFFSPLHQLQPLHQQRRVTFGSSRQHHAYASRRTVGLSAHSTQPPNRSLADIALICLSRCRYVHAFACLPAEPDRALSSSCYSLNTALTHTSGSYR